MLVGRRLGGTAVHRLAVDVKISNRGVGLLEAGEHPEQAWSCRSRTGPSSEKNSPRADGQIETSSSAWKAP
jgi:hypothetical protein